MTITELIIARLSALDFDGLAQLYRPDALLDVSVPQCAINFRVERRSVRRWPRSSRPSSEAHV